MATEQTADVVVRRASTVDDLAVVVRPDPQPADSAVRDGRDYSRPQPLVQVHQPWLRRYTVAVVLADLVAAIVAGLVAVSAAVASDSSWIALLFPPLWVLALATGRTYEHRFVGNGSEEYKRLFHAGIMFLAVCSTLAYATEARHIRAVIVAGIPLAMVLSLVMHWAARQGLHRVRSQGQCMQRAVVVGLERSVAELIRTVRREPYAGLDIVAACIDTPRSESVEDVPVLGSSENIMEVLVRTGADTVAVTAWSDVSQTDLRRLSWDLEGTGVSLLVAPRLTDISGPRIHIRPVAGLPLLN
ncbi:MAG: hypothetical protein WAN48_10055, partial [Actinomycetes bacterium]